MASIVEIEKELLGLHPVERERVTLKAWESLVDDKEVASDPRIDPEGLDFAKSRDTELERGQVKPISDDEFRRLTGGG